MRLELIDNTNRDDWSDLLSQEVDAAIDFNYNDILENVIGPDVDCMYTIGKVVCTVKSYLYGPLPAVSLTDKDTYHTRVIAIAGKSAFTVRAKEGIVHVVIIMELVDDVNIEELS